MTIEKVMTEIQRINIHDKNFYGKIELLIKANFIEAGGIASYYTSPLALREEYTKAEGQWDAHEISYYIQGNLCEPLIDYINYLEGKLVRKAGE